MAFDFKKEYKELYAPKKGPSILEVPPMHFVAVRAVETLTIEEGLCVQCLHIGSYDDEPATRSKFHNRSNERVSSLFRSPFVTVWGYR